jgi:hypothetical protein
VLVLLVGCSVGQGRGEATGSITSMVCGIRDQDLDIRPTFFGAQVSANRTLNIRIQRGSNLEEFSDGFYIQVRDVTDVEQHRLGLPIEITDEYGAPVQMVLFYNETCKSGFPNDRRTQASIFHARSGTVQFDAVYAPEVDAGAAKIQGHFEDVQFTGFNESDEFATLSGTFSFFYQRGSPAQVFP